MYWHAQDAMRAAEKMSTEDCPVKMKLVAPPLYVLTTNVRPPVLLVSLEIHPHWDAWHSKTYRCVHLLVFLTDG